MSLFNILKVLIILHVKIELLFNFVLIVILITACVFSFFQSMRYLENSYDKTKLKIDEASHLKRIYEDIKRKLEVVSQVHHRLE